MENPEDRNKLANVIKSLHKKLRTELKKSQNVELLWSEHIKDKTNLQEYAVAMHELATKYWQNTSDNDPKTSRIYWTWNIIQQYYFGALRKKRNGISDKLLQRGTYDDVEKIRVLDVGSCYNPFSVYTNLDVTAVDLCPAVDSVYKCDFLSVTVNESSKEEITMSGVSSLKACSFDIVIFSLLLEYFPSPFQRWVACKKATLILKDEGLLIIITPDSKAAHSNSKVMKSWRTALSYLGLKRIVYEKLRHVHCMAFKKETADSIYENDEEIAKLMYIPQDLQDVTDSDDAVDIPRPADEEISSAFSFLPYCD